MPPEIVMENKVSKEIATVIKQRSGKRLPANRSEFSLQGFFADRLTLIGFIRAGIPSSLFQQISKYTPFTENEWAAYLNISSKSLKRYREEGHTFKPIQSEKIMELTEVTMLGLDVFGSMEKFRHWLNVPNYALGKHKPLDLLQDSYGKELVTAELIRINHGILV